MKKKLLPLFSLLLLFSCGKTNESPNHPTPSEIDSNRTGPIIPLHYSYSLFSEFEDNLANVRKNQEWPALAFDRSAKKEYLSTFEFDGVGAPSKNSAIRIPDNGDFWLGSLSFDYNYIGTGIEPYKDYGIKRSYKLSGPLKIESYDSKNLSTELAGNLRQVRVCYKGDELFRADVTFGKDVTIETKREFASGLSSLAVYRG